MTEEKINKEIEKANATKSFCDEIAQVCMDIEFDRLNDNPIATIRSMGWDLNKYKTAKDYEYEFTDDDVQKLSSIIAETIIAKKWSPTDSIAPYHDIIEWDEVADYLTNLVAGKIIDKLKLKKDII